MSITQKLADYLFKIKYEELPHDIILKTKMCLVDFLCAEWAAKEDKLSATYRTLAVSLGGADSYKIFGGNTTSLGFAAFANGSIAHIKEVDDLQRKSTMHVGITVFPALLALAEKNGLDGKRFIEATVAGYEAAIRVGETLGREHYAIFHTTGTAGTFGAAAAAAKYLGLTSEETADALGHAGTQAAGLWQFLADGAVATKPAHAGKAAMNGLIAAFMAKDGIKGAQHILEGEKGFGRIGAPGKSMESIAENLDNNYRISEICFKCYPCCGQTHSMLDALRDLMSENSLTKEDISKVLVHAYKQAIALCSNKDPKTLNEARFSLPLCLGCVLSRGNLNFADMEEQILKDEDIRAESQKVEIIFDEEVDKLFPATRPCIIELTLADGRVLSKKNLYRRGDPEKPLRPAELSSKFRSLTADVLTLEHQAMIENWAYSIEDEEKVPEFIYE